MKDRPNKESYVVTTLGLSPEEELKSRMRSYSIIMIIRTISIVLLFVIPIPYSLVFIIIGVFAPIIAVVNANNQNSSLDNGIIERPVKELEGAKLVKREKP